MNAIATQQGGTLALSNDELIDVLTTSLYPGANRQSVKMVLGYCKAAGLDPMQKPVHIVPMWDGKAKQMRDVVMPGVGLYRTQAARTGNFAGQTEPEFGPMVTQKIGGVEITFPEWARVTVKKLMLNGTIAEFTATEYWIENYAAKGGQDKSVAPNAMWSKRPRGQIAKCAAAQALRLAFPEGGAQPTAEEMEGQPLYDVSEPRGAVADADGVIDVHAKPALPAQTDAEFAKNMVIWTKVIRTKKKDVAGVLATVATVSTLTDAQIEAIKGIPAKLAAEAQAEASGPTFASVSDALAKAQDEDALNLAAELINAIPDEQQRKELNASYDARRSELNAD
ncbi:RecT family protein [compost metagenome]